jgi:hypothetical protein
MDKRTGKKKKTKKTPVREPVLNQQIPTILPKKTNFPQ